MMAFGRALAAVRASYERLNQTNLVLLQNLIAKLCSIIEHSFAMGIHGSCLLLAGSQGPGNCCQFESSV